jgi:hypothetical protein
MPIGPFGCLNLRVLGSGAGWCKLLAISCSAAVAGTGFGRCFFAEFSLRRPPLSFADAQTSAYGLQSVHEHPPQAARLPFGQLLDRSTVFCAWAGQLVNGTSMRLSGFGRCLFAQFGPGGPGRPLADAKASAYGLESVHQHAPESAASCLRCIRTFSPSGRSIWRFLAAGGAPRFVASRVQSGDDHATEFAGDAAAPSGPQVFRLGSLLADEVLPAGVCLLKCRFRSGGSTLARTLGLSFSVI